jgi:hydrogenase expression/formation protein HypE
LYVANEGVFIAVVNGDRADEILSRIRRHSVGTNAVRIGTITNEHPGQVICKSLIGGRRVVQMLPGEQLPRIC